MSTPAPVCAQPLSPYFVFTKANCYTLPVLNSQFNYGEEHDPTMRQPSLFWTVESSPVTSGEELVDPGEASYFQLFGGSALSTPAPVITSPCIPKNALHYSLISAETSMFSQIPCQEQAIVQRLTQTHLDGTEKAREQAQSVSKLFGGSALSTPAPVCVFPRPSLPFILAHLLSLSDKLSQNFVLEETAEDPAPHKSIP